MSNVRTSDPMMFLTDLGKAERIFSAAKISIIDQVQQITSSASLLIGLAVVDAWHREAISSRTDAMLKEKRKRFALISKTSKRLLQLLEQDEKHSEDASSITGLLVMHMLFPQEALRGILALVEAELHRTRALKPVKAFRRMSPFEWLAGVWLPSLYRILLPQIGYASDCEDDEKSRLLLFVKAVLAELEIIQRNKSYSEASILRAVTRANSGRTSRRGSGKQEALSDDAPFWDSALAESINLMLGSIPPDHFFRLLDPKPAGGDK